ncbi:S8 family serine peptidase [Carboxylicivirga mesophila]|uniref:S8 family serine peptidase n=1 Tax=Carboxylicivirga mesophila TaxID=1166478 RepID=A0ABS5KG50_9BACT|nr:S8 family serine peptidase [Carboxylicivirga mesophila]MBS2213874.1 S8 family serine peptidase [Carboxylicivirga mesophila]
MNHLRKKLWILLLSYITIWQASAQVSEYTIRNNGREFSPPENGLNSIVQLKSTSETELFQVMQFHQIPTGAERQELKNNGIELKNYIGANAYYVKIAPNQLKSTFAGSNNVRSTFNSSFLQKVANVYQRDSIPSELKEGDLLLKATIHVVSNLEESYVLKELKQIGVTDVESISGFDMYEVIADKVTLDKMAQLGWVTTVMPASPERKLHDFTSQKMHGFITARQNGYDGLSGKGVTVGVWDEDIDEHIDLTGRIHINEAETRGNHGMHVSGIVGGAGVIEQLYEGMAPQVSFETWNFNTGSNGQKEYQEMDWSAKTQGVSITQNSYGMANLLGVKFPYGEFEYGLDLVANQNPELLHVFAAGNSRGYLGVYNTVANSAKNMLSVANMTYKREIASSSSFGPGHFGTLVPHISAHGTAVWSLTFFDQYNIMTGTSMACPMVSGAAAIITEAYENNFGHKPESALLRGIICNTANDLYSFGPDYYSGFGELNVARALENVQNERFAGGEVENQEEQVFSFTISAGQKEARFMLSWLDPASLPTLYNPLINDLDITVVYNNEEYLPLCLDGLNPDFKAKPGRDRINNMEQVVIQDPKPGIYQVKVKGHHVPVGRQKFYVNYQTITDELAIVYPFEGETLVAGSRTLVRWNAYDQVNPTKVYLSTEANQFTEVAELTAPEREFIIDVPNAVSNNYALRLIQGDKVEEVTFNTIGQVKNLSVTDNGNYATLKWDAVQGATTYEVLKYDVTANEYIKTGTVTAPVTEYDIFGSDRKGWYAVRAVVSSLSIEGKRSRAKRIDRTQSLGTSDWPLLIDFEDDNHKELFKSNNTIYAQAIPGAMDTEFFHSKTLTLSGIYGVENDYWTDYEGDPVSEAAGDFAFQNNIDFVTSATMSVNVPADQGSPLLHFDFSIPTTYPNHAYFRVRVNGQLVKDALGREYHHRKLAGDKFAWYGYNQNFGTRLIKEHLYYDLSAFAGQQIDISLEGVCKTGRKMSYDDVYGSEIKIDDLYLDFGNAQQAIMINSATEPQSGIGVSEVSPVINFVNAGTSSLTDFEVSWTLLDANDNQLDNATEQSQIILNPGQGTSFSYSKAIALNTIDKSYRIVYKVKSGDKEATYEYGPVDRYDDYHRAGAPEGNAAPPYVDENPVYITASGGKIYPYFANQYFGFFVEAKDRANNIALELQELDLDEDAVVYILDGLYSYLNESKIIATYTGEQLPENVNTLSSAVSGGLTLIFRSGANVNKKKGFLFKATAEPRAIANDLLVSYIQGAGDSFQSYHSLIFNYPFWFNVSNNGSQAVDAVTARLYIDDVLHTEETFEMPVPAGSYRSFMFTKRLEPFMVDAIHTYRVEIVDEDENMANNVKELVKQIENDAQPETMPDMTIAKVSIGDHYFNDNGGQPDKTFRNEQYGYIDFPDRVFDLEYGTEKEIEVILEGLIAGAGYPTVYIDWNEDGFFSNEEKMQMYADPAYEHRYYGYLKPEVAGEATGLKRMRISLTSEAFLGMEVAHDYRLNLTGTPFNNDFALDYLTANSHIAMWSDLEITVGVMQMIHDEASVDINIEVVNSAGNEVYSTVVENFTLSKFAETKMTIPGDVFGFEGSYEVRASVNHPDDLITRNNQYIHIVKAERTFEPMIAANSGIVYFWNNATPEVRNRFVTFNAEKQFIAMAWLAKDKQLYGLTKAGNSSLPMVYKVNMADGSSEPIVADPEYYAAYNLNDMAIDPSTSMIMALGKSNDLDMLYQIDPLTGAITNLTPGGIQKNEGARFGGMTIEVDGTIYLLDAQNSELCTLSADYTLAATYKKLDRMLKYSQGLAFNRKDGAIYIHGNEEVNGNIEHKYFKYNFQTELLEELHRYNEVESMQLTGMTHAYDNGYLNQRSGILYFHVDGEHKTEIDAANQRITVYLPSTVDPKQARVYAKAINGGRLIDPQRGPIQPGQIKDLTVLGKQMPLIAQDYTFSASSQWWITVVQEDYEMSLTSFNFLQADNPSLAEDMIGTIEGNTITFNASKEADVTNLAASFTVGNGTMVLVNDDEQVSGISANDFSSPKVYKLKHGMLDQEQVYVVRVQKELNTENELFSFEISPRFNSNIENLYQASIDNFTVSLDLSELEVVNSLVPSFTLSSGAYLRYKGMDFTSGTVPFDFKHFNEFEVVSEDGTKASLYTVETVLALSSEADLINFAFLANDNSGLTSDLHASITGNQLVIDMAGVNSQELTVDFRVSPYATLLAGDVELTAGISSLDLTSLTQLKVLAEDGVSETVYSVVLENYIPTNIEAGKDNPRVYPNPATSVLNIQINGAFNWQLVNTAGRVLDRGEAVDFKQINIEAYSNGLYILHITKDDEVMVEKVYFN